MVKLYFITIYKKDFPTRIRLYNNKIRGTYYSFHDRIQYRFSRRPIQAIKFLKKMETPYEYKTVTILQLSLFDNLPV